MRAMAEETGRGVRWEKTQGNDGQGPKGKAWDGLEDAPRWQPWPRAAEQMYLHWLAMGLLGNVTGIFLQSLDAHHHGFCLCEAAHQAREQARQRQGIRKHEAHQPCGEEYQWLGGPEYREMLWGESQL